MGPKEKLHAALTFTEAFDLWIAGFDMKHDTLTTNAKYLSEDSFEDYRVCARALKKFFGAMLLGDVHNGNLEAYQHDRAFNVDEMWKHQAGANCIRKEISLLIRILSEAGCWTKEQSAALHRVKAVEIDVPRAMSPEEQLRFLQAAGSKDSWSFLFAYSVLALQTTASTRELRKLLVGDVMLTQGVIQVRAASAKRRGRIRTIPIETKECRWACEYLIFRAKELGGGAPHHYLFPFGIRGRNWDPSKPMSDSGLKKRFDDVRQAAGLP